MDRRGIAATLFSTVLAGGTAAMIGVAALPEASPYFTVLLYGGIAATGLGALGLVALFIWPGKPKRRTDVTDEVGDESVAIGNNLPKRIGNRSVVVGATDGSNNSILNGTASIGYGAGYAPNSTIIGAYAGHNLGKSAQPLKKSGDDEIPQGNDDQE